MNGPNVNYGLCGICEQPGANMPWTNHISDGAHDHCRERIRALEQELIQRIDELFDAVQIKNAAHGIAITALRGSIDMPIRTFLALNGPEPLTALMRDIGIPTATRYMHRLSHVNEQIIERTVLRIQI